MVSASPPGTAPFTVAVMTFCMLMVTFSSWVIREALAPSSASYTGVSKTRHAHTLSAADHTMWCSTCMQHPDIIWEGCQTIWQYNCACTSQMLEHSAAAAWQAMQAMLSSSPKHRLLLQESGCRGASS